MSSFIVAAGDGTEAGTGAGRSVGSGVGTGVAAGIPEALEGSLAVFIRPKKVIYFPRKKTPREKV